MASTTSTECACRFDQNLEYKHRWVQYFFKDPLLPPFPKGKEMQLGKSAAIPHTIFLSSSSISLISPPLKNPSPSPPTIFLAAAAEAWSEEASEEGFDEKGGGEEERLRVFGIPVSNTFQLLLHCIFARPYPPPSELSLPHFLSAAAPEQ